MTWAVGTDDLDRDAGLLTDAGLAVGPVRSGSRRCPDGSEVTWRSAIVGPPGTTTWPFLIEWPSRGEVRLGVGATVTGLRVTGMTLAVPDPGATARQLVGALGFTRVPGDDLVVTDGEVNVALTDSGTRRPGPAGLSLNGQSRGSFVLDGLTVSIAPERIAL
ncbi:MAG TPA: VOC family protein [Streptosporangiaceae bacterium]|nr:VOC family protein [Streptosporangiaceae bacterium]